MVRDFGTQIEVFEKFTIAGAELSDPLTAFSEIDRVLDACDRFKRPVYLELPRDMVHVVPPVAHGYAGADAPERSGSDRRGDPRNAGASGGGKAPRHRRGGRDPSVRAAGRNVAIGRAAQIPIAATMLGKSVVSERHPLFVGLYEGAIGDQEVTEFVETERSGAVARCLSERHQPRDLHRQARPQSLRLRDQRAIADLASPLSQRRFARVSGGPESGWALSRPSGRFRKDSNNPTPSEQDGPSWKVSSRYEPVGWCGS